MPYPTIDDLIAYVPALSGQMSDNTETLYQGCIDAAIALVELTGNQEFDLTASEVRQFEVQNDGRTIITDNIGSATISVTIKDHTGTDVAVTVSPYPLNAVAKGKPYHWLEISGHQDWCAGHFPMHRQQRIATVTTEYGWPTMSAGAFQAVLIQAYRFTQRPQTPAGYQVWGGDNGSGAIRLSRLDPDVAALVPVRSTYVH